MNYKIICFDGGGLKGLISIVIMRRLYEAVPELFNADLWSGTSTGGIIALALANKGSTKLEYTDPPGGAISMPQTDADRLAAVEKLYYDKGKDIFKKKRFNLWNLFSSKYSNKTLRKLLHEFFGEVTLGEISPVLIPAFDLDRTHTYRKWAPKFFDNLGEVDKNICVEDVAAYTSAAPTFFPSVDGFIDGGVCANNPSMSAVTAALDKCDTCLSKIRVLSIGTGQGLQYIKGSPNWGYYKWAPKLLDVLFDGIVDVPDFQCKAILKNHYCRINPKLGNVPKIDDWKARDYLVEVGNTVNLDLAVEWLQKEWV